MSCGSPEWLQNLGLTPTSVGEYAFTRDYFDCGKYFFDGQFNVVQFPKGMSIYHGSTNLAMANVEFPSGALYETELLSPEERKKLRANPDPQIHKDAIRKVFTDHSNNGWFGDYTTATYYSNQQGSYGSATGKFCGKGCIYAYKLRQDATFIVMNDAHNVYRILSEYPLSPEERQSFINDYALDPVDWRRNFSKSIKPDSPHPLKLLESTANRISGRSSGYTVPKVMCRLTGEMGYTGYGHHRTLQVPGHPERLAELVLCRPKLHLARDYHNPLDWQYHDKLSLANHQALQRLISTMKTYHTSNMDWHGGDPYDHSIWTALWTEHHILNNTKWWVDVTHLLAHDPAFLEQLKQASIMAAFLHDVGKFGDGIQYFYNKESHPADGAQYLLGLKPFLYSDGTRSNLGQDLSADFPEWEIRFIAWVAASHYDFGEALQRREALEKSAEPESVKVALSQQIADEYVNLVIYRLREVNFDLSGLHDMHLIAMVVALVCISVSDVQGTLPPPNKTEIIDAVTSQVQGGVSIHSMPKMDWNLRSVYYPFISNTSREYHGKDAYNLFQYDTRGFRLLARIKNYFQTALDGNFSGTKLTHG